MIINHAISLEQLQCSPVYVQNRDPPKRVPALSSKKLTGLCVHDIKKNESVAVHDFNDHVIISSL